MSEAKKARPDHPIDDLISSRWSPYVFADRPVPEADLRSLFEAARWAASSYNEQPWRYIVATKENPKEFDRLLSCLVEANRVWAKHVPVLALGVVSLQFERNGNPNRTAPHDLGLASASLSFEATKRGLSVHQMAGIEPERARERYHIPDAFEAFTGLAVGYRGEADADDDLGKRDLSARTRRPVSEFVFSGDWGQSLLG